MPHAHEDRLHTLATVRIQLEELAAVLAQVAGCLRYLAEHNRRFLLELERCGSDPVAGLAAGMRERLERAKAISRKPTRRVASSGIPPLRYAQYVEFSSLEELLKFKDLPPIRREQIARVNWDELLRRLLAGSDPPS